MKYTQLHTKTAKVAKEYDSTNATLLIKAGFIHQTMAGVYSFLPLGLRVLNKIEQIVREEMNTVGTEVLLPALSPKKNWQDTNRLDTVDVLMKTMGANKASQQKSTNEYVLNSTHEEIITPIAKQFAVSYKDLPVAWYQIQSKFRNEARAKSGLLRGREFRMKDLYSFHDSQEDLMRYYEEVKAAYTRVYKRLGLGKDTVIALASGGDFTKDYSHEFQTKCDNGEDLIFYLEHEDAYYNQEVAPSKAPAVTYTTPAQPMREIETPNCTGMDDLVKFLNVPAQHCCKTVLYETETGEVIAAGIRGTYDINEDKLTKVVGAESIRLASAETIQRVTGAAVGYAGIVNLPKEVRVVVDDSLEDAVNFECGANKTDHHLLNVNWDADIPRPEAFYDIKVAQPGDLNPNTGKEMPYFAASEVGNIFPLNTKFSQAISYTYTAEDGTEKPVYMGSYGIGTSRLMGVLVEKFHDEAGIVWPAQVAPFQVHLVSLNGAENAASELYAKLLEAGVEVLWDDRDTSAGSKFADADLIGCPVRLVLSKKTGEKVEWKTRTEQHTELISINEVLERITAT